MDYDSYVQIIRKNMLLIFLKQLSFHQKISAFAVVTILLTNLYAGGLKKGYVNKGTVAI